MSRSTIHVGNCLDVMATMEANSVDSIVTDPPYGLSFMGKDWDHGIPGEAFWREALRVAKPGSHLLAFGGTRTFHRLTVAIEDAGWEIRDCIMWVYGSGFPKSHDVSKAIDKMNGREFEDRYELGRHIRDCREKIGVSRKDVNERFGAVAICNHWEAQDRNNALPPTPEHWAILKQWLGCDSKFDALVDRIGAEREVVGQKTAGIANPDDKDRHTIGGSASVIVDITAPSTDAARQWQGWGTALKPAWEPIIVARKPLAGTVAANVLTWGTGAINVDGGRVGNENTKTNGWKCGGEQVYNGRQSEGYSGATHSGRWPANLIHEGSDEATAGMGEAARYFYCAKASKADRGSDNHHPTVKPNPLMRYLVKLVTPPGGTVLDPFCGSGSTGKAAVMEGFGFVGIELNPEYAEIARRRIDSEVNTCLFPS